VQSALAKTRTAGTTKVHIPVSVLLANVNGWMEFSDIYEKKL